MCLILFSYEAHPYYRLILGANRDEFHERPTAPLAYWRQAEGMPATTFSPILAGKDLRGGGTWMGVTQTGRFAALTNFRDPAGHQDGAPSRGALVTNFLAGREMPRAYLDRLHRSQASYNGYNLLAGDRFGLFCHSNRRPGVAAVAPGIHGLSNRFLDSPWPKVERGKKALASVAESPRIAPEAVLAILMDRERPPDDHLPDTGVGGEWERILSPIFITSPTYGTRSSSVLLVSRDGGVEFVERTFLHEDGGAKPQGTRRFQFTIR